MSASHNTTPKIAKYVLYIIIFAILYEFLPGVNMKSFFPDINLTPYKVITGAKSINDNLNNNGSSQNTNNQNTKQIDNKNNDRQTLNSIIESKKYKIKKVVDGDTVDIYEIDNTNTVTRVRLIGINTPETVDPRRPVECYGKEASNYAKSILNNQNVIVEVDRDRKSVV